MTSTASALSTETKVICADAGVKPSQPAGTDSAPFTVPETLTVASSSFLDRLLTAYYALCQRERVARLTYTELAKRVEGHTGIPVVQTTVTRWFTGAMPEAPLAVGLAKALGEGLPGGVDPGWLYFGDDSAAPVPRFKEDARRFLPAITPEEAEAGREQRARGLKRRRKS